MDVESKFFFGASTYAHVLQLTGTDHEVGFALAHFERLHATRRGSG